MECGKGKERDAIIVIGSTVFTGLTAHAEDLIEICIVYIHPYLPQQLQFARTMASVLNGSFASPLANADFPAVSDDGLLSRVYNGISGLSMFMTFLLMLVAYDQCELSPLNSSREKAAC